MNWSKFWYVVSLIGLAVLLISFGFVLGNRMYEQRQDPVIVDVTHWNGATNTPLNSIKSTPLFGRSSEGEIRSVGTLYLYESNNELDFVIRFDSMPLSFNLSDKQFATPTSFEIYAARRTQDGTAYTTSRVGTVNLIQTDNKLTGRFPGNLKTQRNETPVERFLFLNGTGNSELPPAVSLDFLPTNVRNQAAPYAWSESLARAN